MFNIGFSELIVILLVALIFVGPKDLPKVGVYVGRAVKKFKRYIAEFKDETGLGEMEKEYKETVADLKTVIHEADPTKELKEAERDFRRAGEDVNAALKDVKNETDAIRDAVTDMGKHTDSPVSDQT